MHDLEVSEQVCGSMELQAQVSWLPGPLLFEVTGAQQEDFPPKAVLHSLLCQCLPEQPSREQQQRCVQEVQRLPGPVSVLLKEVCSAAGMLQEQKAQHPGPGQP